MRKMQKRQDSERSSRSVKFVVFFATHGDFILSGTWRTDSKGHREDRPKYTMIITSWHLAATQDALDAGLQFIVYAT
ncbi:MAG TPA: hypothetical protein VMF12_03825 [Xanthobacteraceae bacterium]|nr:hypothetical protein [Xanthobacteraceae bacterium]